MEIRNKLQIEAVEKYQNKGIFLLAPRFGKIKTCSVAPAAIIADNITETKL